MNSASSVSHAIDHVKDAASTVQEGLLDLGVQTMKFVSAARSQRVHALDSALRHIGLQRRRSAFRPVLFLVGGAILGGALAVVVAPTSAKKLRRKMVDLLGAPKGGHAASHDITTVGQSGVAGATSLSNDGVNGAS